MPRTDDSSNAGRVAALALLMVGLPLVPMLLYPMQLRGAGPAQEGGPHQVREPGGTSCPIPVARQVAAVTAFRRMMPVFHHPRCFNCHGGFDPRAETHAGSDEARASGLDPLAGLLTVEQRVLYHKECGSCHDNIRGTAVRPTAGDPARSVSGWMLAPFPMQWKGKTTEQLCKDLKRFERDGNEFIDHVLRDHEEVQFVEAAFRGDRGLGPDGLVDYHLTAAPPPGTAAQLVAHAQRWVDQMKAEDGWVGDPDCGCVMPKLELRVRHRSEINPGHSTHRAGFLGFSGEVAFEVTLDPIAELEGRYRGEASVVRALRVYHANPHCQGTASQREHWWFNADLDEEANVLKLHLGFTSSEETGSSSCKIRGHVATMEISPNLSTEIRRTEVPLDGDATKRETGTVGNGKAQEWLEVSVVGVPSQQ